MYKLYLDKPEEFICEVQIKNASLNNSKARLIIESDDLNLVFHGHIENGRCIIPIRRLQGLLGENTQGKMKLELIVENTYFEPWTSDFIVEEHTSVKVMVNEQKSSYKPVIDVKVKDKSHVCSKPQKIIKENKQSLNTTIPIKEISLVFKMFGINKKNISKKKNDISQILTEYFNINPEYKPYKNIIISKIKSAF
jgi:hypothetical protein